MGGWVGGEVYLGELFKSLSTYYWGRGGGGGGGGGWDLFFLFIRAGLNGKRVAGGFSKGVSNPPM